MVLIATLALVVAIASLVTAAVTRRTASVRIADAERRLGAPPAADHGERSLTGSLTALDRATNRAAAELQGTRRGMARAARAIDALPQGIVICDEDGVEVLRNEVARAFTSARHAEVLVEQAIQDALRSARGGEPLRRDIDLLGPPRRVLVVSAVPLDDGARPGGAVALVEDVSERRRLEAVRRDFVANISHELKTPVGALGLLAETVASEDDPEVTRRLAARMTSEAMRVGRLIDDLLALSRIEVEEQPVHELLTVRSIVDEAVERLRVMAESRRITISAEAVGRRHTVSGDRRQLIAAVANLLENACKYSDDRSLVTVSSAADGTWVEVAVTDHGVGIPSTDLERVFERFYRVDRARSRDTGGTGLGLAIVRHVATNHRGDVRVESREGEGSTFTLRLPSGPGPVAVGLPEPAIPPRREADTA